MCVVFSGKVIFAALSNFHRFVDIFIFSGEFNFAAPPTFHRASMEVRRHLYLLRRGHLRRPPSPNLP
ncbi:hypothetical protein TIFTF001_021252 [Ficus carica]|uniref:Uncharacterized protein n=1 Tax=Ficus carica TaxID=3494 RepID=A0AA88AA51_FICCA|nr:hypothetical protein TIFTF001_021252 [Ficus carica]